jgi:serine/threonine protein kinase
LQLVAFFPRERGPPAIRTVAVEILTEKGRADGDVNARFLAEARTAGSISHENILGIHDFGEDDEYWLFMVMEYLHSQNIVHRDLKPEKVHIFESGQRP